MATSVGNGADVVGWRRLRRRLLAWEFTPARVTVLYLVLGFGALYASDVLLVRALDEPLLSQIQAVKGGVEVLATGGLIYLLTRRSRAQLRRTNKSLERQREELDVLHRVIRHNLRNALTVIVGTAEQLKLGRRLDDEERDHCTRIENTAVRIVELVEQASRIRRVTNGVDPVTVDLTETVQAVVEKHPTAPAGVDLRTDLPETAPASVNHLFDDALGELLSNAIEHSDRDRPRVAIAVDPDAGPPQAVEVTVADDGPGIHEHVHDVFERGELDQLLHLDGMGLWFVYWTVTDAGGNFAIEENEWGGTTVRLTLPKPTHVGPAVAGSVGEPALASASH